MHEAGIVADEERGAREHRRRRQQIDVADQIDGALARQGGDHRRCLIALMRRRHDNNAGAEQRARRRREPRRQLGKTLGTPFLAAPIGGGADGENRPARRQQRSGAGDMRWVEP